MERMSSTDFGDLLAFERVYGSVWMPERLDYAVARLQAFQYNLRRRRGSRRLKASELLPIWPASKRAGKRLPNAQELERRFMAAVNLHNQATGR